MTAAVLLKKQVEDAAFVDLNLGLGVDGHLLSGGRRLL